MKFKYFFISFLLSFICFTSMAQTEDRHSQYIALMDSADRCIGKEDWNKAEVFLLEALRLEPANPSNLLLISNLGMIRFYQGRDSLAIATLNDAVEMAPNSVVVRQNRAKVLSALGRHSEAYMERGKIIEIDSTNVNTLYLHALAAMTRDDSLMLNRDLRLLTEFAPNDSRTLRITAQKLVSSGKYKEAIPSLNKLSEIESEPEIHSMKALCFLMTNQLNEASEEIAEGLRLDPTDGELYLYRSLLNKLRYRNDDSYKDAKRAIELGIPEERARPLLK